MWSGEDPFSEKQTDPAHADPTKKDIRENQSGDWPGYSYLRTTKAERKSMTAVNPPETILKASASGPPKRHPTKLSTASAKTIPPTSRRVKSGIIHASNSVRQIKTERRKCQDHKPKQIPRFYSDSCGNPDGKVHRIENDCKTTCLTASLAC